MAVVNFPWESKSIEHSATRVVYFVVSKIDFNRKLASVDLQTGHIAPQNNEIVLQQSETF